jgi:hypothetical protein
MKDEVSAERAAPTQKIGGAPVIASDAAVFDFGEVKPTAVVEHVFTIRNEGDADLHIDRVEEA